MTCFEMAGTEYAEGAMADPKLKAVISPHAGGGVEWVALIAIVSSML
jgi:hypothetical protein